MGYLLLLISYTELRFHPGSTLTCVTEESHERSLQSVGEVGTQGLLKMLFACTASYRCVCLSLQSRILHLFSFSHSSLPPPTLPPPSFPPSVLLSLFFFVCVDILRLPRTHNPPASAWKACYATPPHLLHFFLMEVLNVISTSAPQTFVEPLARTSEHSAGPSQALSQCGPERARGGGSHGQGQILDSRPN